MGFNESFEAAKNFAVNAAQTAAQKAKVLAAIAKTNVSIYAEEDKIKKAEVQLGKLYYRDYAVGEEMDSAEYLPWCQKIDESKKLIAELKDYIDSLKQEDAVAEEAFVDVDVPHAGAPFARDQCGQIKPPLCKGRRHGAAVTEGLSATNGLNPLRPRFARPAPLDAIKGSLSAAAGISPPVACGDSPLLAEGAFGRADRGVRP